MLASSCGTPKNVDATTFSMHSVFTISKVYDLSMSAFTSQICEAVKSNIERACHRWQYWLSMPGCCSNRLGRLLHQCNSLKCFPGGIARLRG